MANNKVKVLNVRSIIEYHNCFYLVIMVVLHCVSIWEFSPTILRLEVCWLYLVLNSFSVIPMYMSFWLVCFCTTVASYFPPNNKLHKIINKNTVKLSYSCMNNVQQIINSHNKTILTSAAENNSKLCKCREKNSCPLNGKCLQKGVVYQATVVQKHTNQKDTYLGIKENKLKTRYNQHLQLPTTTQKVHYNSK